MPRSQADLIGGAACLGVSALLYAQTVGTGFSDAEIARDPVFYPRLLLALLALLSIGLLVRSFAGKPSGRAARPVWWRFLAVALLTAAYFLLFDVVGFLIASLVAMPALTVLLGYRRPLVTALVTVIFVVAVWYCFADLFVIRPPGFGLDDLSGWL